MWVNKKQKMGDHHRIHKNQSSRMIRTSEDDGSETIQMKVTVGELDAKKRSSWRQKGTRSSGWEDNSTYVPMKEQQQKKCLIQQRIIV